MWKVERLQHPNGNKKDEQISKQSTARQKEKKLLSFKESFKVITERGRRMRPMRKNKRAITHRCTQIELQKYCLHFGNNG